MNNVESDMIQEWNAYFESLDTESTGTISIKELIKLIAKTGRFKTQLKQLKELSKNNPDLKIEYSDFLLRIVDLRKEIKAEDIANAFFHLDSQKTGKIRPIDLQKFFKRRGEEISEEQALDMIRKAELKLSSLSIDFKDKRTNCESEMQVTTKDGMKQIDELDYKAFKTYLIAPSPESHQNNYLKYQSSIRFSEYKAFANSSVLDQDCSLQDGPSKLKYLEMQKESNLACDKTQDEKEDCDGTHINILINTIYLFFLLYILILEIFKKLSKLNCYRRLRIQAGD